MKLAADQNDVSQVLILIVRDPQHTVIVGIPDLSFFHFTYCTYNLGVDVVAIIVVKTHSGFGVAIPGRELH